MSNPARPAVERVAAALVWGWHFSKAWLSRVLSLAATLATAIWATYGAAMWSAGWGWFVVAVVCALGGLAAEFGLQRPSYMEQAKLLAQVRAKADRRSRALTRAMVILLRELARYCEIQGHNDRLTVYYFHNGSFFAVARRAQNPQYRGYGRQSYPIGQGYLGQSWENEHGVVLGTMPANPQAWDAAARRLGFSDVEIEGMRMRSRSISAIRLARPQGSIGVLVMESTAPKRHTMDMVTKAKDSHVLAAIQELAAEFAMMTPQGEAAERRRQEQPDARPWQGAASAKPPRKTS